MELDKEVIDKLEAIRFYERLILIEKNHQNDTDDKLRKYDNKEVIQIFADLGYTAKYYRNENFFQIEKEKENYKFFFNISLKYGCCEFIWGLSKNDEKIRLGPWVVITQLMGFERSTFKSASFTSYNELKEILRDAMALYEDFFELL